MYVICDVGSYQHVCTIYSYATYTVEHVVYIVYDVYVVCSCVHTMLVFILNGFLSLLDRFPQCWLMPSLHIH